MVTGAGQQPGLRDGHLGDPAGPARAGHPPDDRCRPRDPRRQSIESGFLETLQAAGIEAATIDARSLRRQQVNTSIGAAGDTVMTAPLVDFLSGCFA